MKQELENTLSELRAMVTQASMTTEERSELHDALESLVSSLDDDSVDSAQMAGTIYERVLDFQQAHPTLTKTMNQVAETLAQMGI